MANNYYNGDETEYEQDNPNIYETDKDYDTDDENAYNEQDLKPLYELHEDDTYEEKKYTEYATLKIGISYLIVSSEGMIRKKDDIFTSSMGFALPGTPYRTYPVEIKENRFENYFVHDLVWRAFNGDPPDGWEVRHRFWEAKLCAEFYNNSIDSLDIYPSTIIYMPSSRKLLPSAD